MSNIWTFLSFLMHINKLPYGKIVPVYLLSFSHSVRSNSLWTHGLQHARFPCPSLSPWVSWILCPLSWQCHPTISSSVTLFSSCPQPFLASRSFPMSLLFALGGQSIGASASVLPMNTAKVWIFFYWIHAKLEYFHQKNIVKLINKYIQLVIFW